MQQDDKARHEIRKIAYALWIEEGQPEGRDREHWEAAKEIWAFRSHDHARSDTEAPAAETAGRRHRPDAA
jgi:hypothetical protein